MVYLADDPALAGDFVANSQFGNDGEIVMLRIDAHQLKRSLLRADDNDEDAEDRGEYGGSSYEYDGVIPASALTKHEW